MVVVALAQLRLRGRILEVELAQLLQRADLCPELVWKIYKHALGVGAAHVRVLELHLERLTVVVRIRTDGRVCSAQRHQP